MGGWHGHNQKPEGREGIYPAPLRMRLIFLFLYRCIFLDLIRFYLFILFVFYRSSFVPHAVSVSSSRRSSSYSFRFSFDFSFS